MFVSFHIHGPEIDTQCVWKCALHCRIHSILFNVGVQLGFEVAAEGAVYRLTVAKVQNEVNGLLILPLLRTEHYSMRRDVNKD